VSTSYLGRRSRPFGLRDYVGWIALSVAGVLLGMASIYVLIFAAKALVPGTNEDRLMGSALWPVLGAFIGAGQWLLLRGRVPRAGWWIPLTAAGLWGGTTLAFRVVGSELPIRQLDLILAGAGVGLCLGLAQLIVLRPSRRGLLIWLLISALGWLCLAALIGQSLDRTTDLIALGAIPAAFTGMALAWSGDKARLLVEAEE